VSRAAQNLLMVLLGAAVLWITVVTDEYLTYVRPGFRYFLVPAAVALIVLGGAGLRREWGRSEHESQHESEHADEQADGAGHPPETGDEHAAGAGHAHADGRGPKVAWLLCLPAAAIFLIAPPPLGAFLASRDTGRTPPPPATENYPPLPATGPPTAMTMAEFISRAYLAQTKDPSGLQERRVKLTGFVMPRPEGGWFLTRMRINCCAGDALPLQVIIRGRGQPPADRWVEVEGTWRPLTDPVHFRYELDADRVREIKKPKNTYEG
jgi:uncharacterized repeat protein (TIGR03943 family)